ALPRYLHAYRIWRKLRVLESVAGGAVLSAVAAHRAAHTPLAGTGLAADRALSTVAGTHPGDDGIALLRPAARRAAGRLEPHPRLPTGQTGVPAAFAIQGGHPPRSHTRLPGPARLG